MNRTVRHGAAVLPLGLAVAWLAWFASREQQVLAGLAAAVLWSGWATRPAGVGLLRHLQAQLARIVGPVALVLLLLVGLWSWVEPRLEARIDRAVSTARDAATPDLPSLPNFPRLPFGGDR